MTASAWIPYDIFKEELGKEGHSLNGVDTVKFALLNSGYTPATTTDEDFSTIDADELATANGYTVGGVTVATTWDAAAGVLIFDAADATWNPTGAGITARFVVAYNASKGGSKDLIAYSLLDNTPGDVVAVAGTPFIIANHASGMLRIT